MTSLPIDPYPSTPTTGLAPNSAAPSGASNELSFDDHLHRSAPAADEHFEVHGWANVMRYGHTVKPHDHVKSHLGGNNAVAGCFYLTMPPGSAEIIFVSEGDKVVRHFPQEDEILLWPETLYTTSQPTFWSGSEFPLA